MPVRICPHGADAFVDDIEHCAPRTGARAKAMGPTPKLEQDPVTLRGALGRLRLQYDELAEVLRGKEQLLEREQRARAELERVNRTKDRFIAVLAHDLRSPLSAILGWTQLLRHDALDPRARSRAFGIIERSAQAQARLVEELLDISRMEADRIRLVLGAVDAADVVRGVVEGALPRAALLGLDLTLDIEPGLEILGDRGRLEQIVSNLVSNAIQYTPRGGRIIASAKRDGAYARLVVRDSGSGIAAEYLPHVFDMFSEGRNDAHVREGLGLGLYIVKQLVELHDGTVHVESDGIGHGTTFIVRIPRPAEIMDPEPKRASASNLDGIRVLVVDDDADSRELMAMLLRLAGAEVASANSGHSALEIADSWPPNVVVSDLSMPDGDGAELIRALRQREPSVGALAVSGFTFEPEKQHALEAGFDLHMGKPIDADEFIDSVRQAFQRRPR